MADQPHGVGEPCSVEGSAVSGIDSCDGSSMCFGVDGETNMGECYAFCTGDWNNPMCDAAAACVGPSDGMWALCIPRCDPTLLDTCDEDEVCIWDDDFSCVPNTDLDGAFLDPCESINACDAGLFCIEPYFVDECASEEGCCTPYCDLAAPECPGTTTCMPFFEDGHAPDGLEHVGACVN